MRLTEIGRRRATSFILANKLALDVLRQARVTAIKKLREVFTPNVWRLSCCASAAAASPAATTFEVPLLAGDHVTDDAGTGFVHTAPGHGREDFDVWTANARELAARGINTTIPYTVDADGRFTDQAPGFTGKRVLTDKGEKGDANEAVIKALIEAGMLIARGRLKHQYPHSWRSKKPVIFRNTPQWFIAMDKPIVLAGRRRGQDAAPTCARSDQGDALGAGAGREPHQRHDREPARLGDLAPARLGRADHGVHQGKAGRLGRHPRRSGRQCPHHRGVRAEGADAWYKPGARERFLGKLANEGWQKVDDILDVWFDSGSTHAFVLEDPQHFPGARRHSSARPTAATRR